MNKSPCILLRKEKATCEFNLSLSPALVSSRTATLSQEGNHMTCNRWHLISAWGVESAN